MVTGDGTCGTAVAGDLLSGDLRWLFVSFLFAVVTSDIAVKFSKLVRMKSSWNKVTAVSHLTLSAVVVVTSWLGWSIATKNQCYPQVTDVFSRATLLVVMDIVILISYYALVSGIEVETPPRVNDAEQPARGNAEQLHAVPPNGARHVSLWSTVILFWYFVWDLTTGFVTHSSDSSWIRGRVSAGCVVLAFVAYLLFRRVDAKCHISVLVADVALASLFLLFRAVKQSLPLCKQQQPLQHVAPQPIVMWVLLFMFIVATGLAVGLIRITDNSGAGGTLTTS